MRNAVASRADFAAVGSGAREVLDRVALEPGLRHAGSDESTDQVAACGVAALAGGVTAGRAGPFARRGLRLPVAKKPAIPLRVGIGCVRNRIFGGKDASQPT